MLFTTILSSSWNRWSTNHYSHFFHYSHFRGEENKAQSGQITCSQFQSQCLTEPKHTLLSWLQSPCWCLWTPLSSEAGNWPRSMLSTGLQGHSRPDVEALHPVTHPPLGSTLGLLGTSNQLAPRCKEPVRQRCPLCSPALSFPHPQRQNQDGRGCLAACTVCLFTTELARMLIYN